MERHGTFVFFHNYTREEDVERFKPKINVVEKRVGVFPFTFKQKWMNIWCKTQSKKEVGFMWALWNIEGRVDGCEKRAKTLC
jgi:hypothetical protein